MARLLVTGDAKTYQRALAISMLQLGIEPPPWRGHPSHAEMEGSRLRRVGAKSPRCVGAKGWWVALELPGGANKPKPSQEGSLANANNEWPLSLRG